VQSSTRPSSRFGLLLILASLSVLAGCTSVTEWVGNGFKVGPNYHEPYADVASDWLEEPEDQLIKDTAGDYRAWWSQFNDPVLDQLVDMTYRENLTLKIACWRIQEARALRAIAAGNLFPQSQDASGGFGRAKLSKNGYPLNLLPFPRWYFDNWNAGFNAAWELDVWGRLRRYVEAADANLESNIADYNQVLILLQAEIASTYIQFRAFDERLILARKNVDLQKRTVDIIQKRFDEGLVSDLDIQQAKSNLAITESLIPQLQAGRRQTHNRICVLVAMPPTDLASLLGPTRLIPTAPAEVAVGVPADLLRRRPDVRSAERKLAAQSARIGIATAELYPHIAITGTIGVESEQLAQLFTQDSLSGSVGPGFQWNLLNYGRILSNIRLEDARFQQACFNYRETVLKANEEVENSISNYLQEKIRIRSLSASVQHTERAEHLAMLQYEQGLIDYQRLLDTQRVLVETQDRLAESRGLVAINLVLLYKSLGGGWQTYCCPVGMPIVETPDDAAAAAPPEPIPAVASLAPLPETTEQQKKTEPQANNPSTPPRPLPPTLPVNLPTDLNPMPPATENHSNTTWTANGPNKISIY
jgi:NodT family efflux transporter outer membrane factor (OMF) lipoprotein